MSRERDRDGAPPRKPRPIAEALAEVLARTGLDEDVARAAVLASWGGLVGTQIAAVTQPRIVSEDGTLVVGVKTHGWMSELTMMERTLVAKVNAAHPSTPIKRIRWELLR
jgi:predicted nucleic acid-binding Zn ribbon protein